MKETIVNENYIGFNSKINENKEMIYKSNQFRPLGKSSKGFQNLPEEILNKKRTFGKKSGESKD